MTLDDVRRRLADVRAAAGDSEVAHGMEDDLWRDVLAAIATGQCRDAPPEDFAALALESSLVEFVRWRA